jgi:DNA processing protein
MTYGAIGRGRTCDGRCPSVRRWAERVARASTYHNEGRLPLPLRTVELGLFDDLRPRALTGWRDLSPELLSAIFVLDEIPFFGPQKFRELFEQGLTPEALLADTERLVAIGGKRGPSFVTAHAEAVRRRPELEERAATLFKKASTLGARLLSYADDEYPPVLLRSNYPVPVLYARGAVGALKTRQTVACVGSRQIRPPYSELQAAFAREAAGVGSAVVSGFALGADTIAHEAAVEASGTTIGVMAGGVDRAFPPENRGVWDRLLSGDRAVFVSEAPFGARASSLTLRRRNKLIVGNALGVLVGQSAVDGGAMNAYRFGLEDHKPVSTFVGDGQRDTSGNALIARDPRAGGRAFGLRASAEEYRGWLQELGSST